jgi:hypothetical protein
VCPIANGTFCAGVSLSTPIFVICTNSKPSLFNCQDTLGDSSAICYQSSATAGNAACAAHGVVYPPGSPSYSYATSASLSGSAATPSLPPAVSAHFNGTQCGCKNGTHPTPPGGPVSGWSSYYPPPVVTKPVSSIPPLSTGTGYIPCTNTTTTSSTKLSVSYKPTTTSKTGTPSTAPVFTNAAASKPKLKAGVIFGAGLMGAVLL